MSNVGMGILLEGELESLCNIFTTEAPDFGAQFLSHATNSSLVASSSDYNEYFYYEFHSDNTSDTTSYNNNPLELLNSYQNCQFPVQNDAVLPMKIGVMDQTNLGLAPFSCAISTTVNVGTNTSPIGSVEDNGSDNLESPHSPEVRVKRKSRTPEVQAQPKIKAPSNKKARVSNDRGKESIESVKSAQEHESNVGLGENSDSSESDVYQETNEGKNSASKELVSEISKGKKRASKGTATDPQSLYARKRRERINERLRILQNLVPNGTKVDISTMLEEAVQYVKFLQLQIRLLSSDDLWMYAPIAYNGIDINLYKRISPFSLP